MTLEEMERVFKAGMEYVEDYLNTSLEEAGEDMFKEWLKSQPDRMSYDNSQGEEQLFVMWDESLGFKSIICQYFDLGELIRIKWDGFGESDMQVMTGNGGIVTLGRQELVLLGQMIDILKDKKII